METAFVIHSYIACEGGMNDELEEADCDGDAKVDARKEEILTRSDQTTPKRSSGEQLIGAENAKERI